jgi:hypothetical protein
MCKNEFFQSTWIKNELFKVQGQKRILYKVNLETKTIV